MEKENSIKRIAIIGAESTGKSTLAEKLAIYYHTQFVTEHSRDYVATLGRKYNKADIEIIARKQWFDEQEKLKTANEYLFVDTEFIIAKIWSLDVYKECDAWINEMIRTHPYDLYLLTANDIQWVTDPVRENANRRVFFFNWYKKELEEHDLPFKIVNGQGDERLQNAVAIIDNYFKL